MQRWLKYAFPCCPVPSWMVLSFQFLPPVQAWSVQVGSTGQPNGGWRGKLSVPSPQENDRAPAHDCRRVEIQILFFSKCAVTRMLRRNHQRSNKRATPEVADED